MKVGKLTIQLQFILILLLPGFILQAQNLTTGAIKGQVFDSETGNPLSSCNVIVESTLLGAASESDGRFLISNLKPGAYRITALMIGYKKETRAGIVVKTNKTTVIRFDLVPTVINLPTMVVTASKRRQTIEETPVSVDVVNREAIASRNVTTLDEVLANTAGVGIIDGQIDIRGSTGFNWAAGSRVLLMVDGHPLINGDTGGISWDAIPVEVVESVEVVKGAGSALYGSNAMAGMINIITRDPSTKPETSFRLSTGFYDKPAYSGWQWTDNFIYTQLKKGQLNLKKALSMQSLDITHSRKLGPVGLLLTIGRKISDGYHQNGDYSRWNVMGKAKIKPAPNQTLVISANWAIDDHGDFLQWKSQDRALEVPVAEKGNRVTYEKTNLNATFKHGVNTRFAYSLKANAFRVDWQNYFNDNNDYAITDRIGFEGQIDYIRGRHAITFGSETVLYKTTSLIYGNQSTSDAAVYCEDVITVKQKIKLTLGGRYDYHYVKGIGADQQFSPRLGFTAQAWRGGSLRASAGYGFRAPSIAEVFANLTVSGFRVVPNLSLKEAERAWNFELGLRQALQIKTGGEPGGKFFKNPFRYIADNLNPVGMIDLALFYNRYTNMIDVDLNTDLMAFQFINLNKARNLGAELRVSAGLFNGSLNVNSGFTVIDPLNLETGKMLNYRSRYRFNGGISLKAGSFTLAWDYRYASRAEEVVDIFKNDQRVPMHVMDGRLIYNTGKYQISFETKNIRNYHYSLRQRSIMPIRHFVLAIRGKI